MQLTFGDVEELGKRKRREIFLGEMEQVVPWKALLSLIELHLRCGVVKEVERAT